MARIPTDQLERIKQDISLLTLIESQGYTVTKQGKDHAIACPFHEDDTPSLIISPKTNLFNCFGCGAAGSVIDWVMKTKGVSFRLAVEVLLADHFPATAEKPVPVARTRKPQLDPLFDVESDNQAVLQQVIQFYHETLKQTPEALAYLESRGLGDSELIDRFKLGYANRTLGYRLPPKRTKTGDALRGQLTEIGLYRESGHEHFNGSLVVPVFNGEGHVVEAYGRKIRDDLRKGTPKHLYLPGSHGGVWNADGLADHKEVILCEALIDAMTFWVNGYKNVTASYGTQGFTADHLAALKCNNIRRVLIAYDRDEAGNKAAKKLAEQLQQEGLACYRLHFPKGMDANEYALQGWRSAERGHDCKDAGGRAIAEESVRAALNTKPASKSLGIVIRSAEPFNTLAETFALPEKDVEHSVLPASAEPPKPDPTIEAIVDNNDIKIDYGNRHYRVRGLEKNTSYDVLKVNTLLSVNNVITVDTFDIYSAKHRQGFARLAAVECDVEEKTIQRDLGQLLLQLETLQDKAIQASLKPKEPEAYQLSDKEREASLTLLRDPNLAERIVSDFAKTGLVGEPTNALMGYLAVVSRKLSSPLAIIVQSTSAAGKSALMDAVLKLVPEEDRVHYSAMTGQSLFYLGETNLKHKILGIAEEEGVRQAAYALKLLQSEGELTIASTGKDPQSGKLVTEEYHVEGPVMLFLTTTAIDIDEELLNRCVVLTINESREQTAAIQQKQRQARTLEGLLASKQSDQLIQQHQNAQRLLKPLAIVNPYAEQLAFADSRTRTRRDHQKYLTLIDSIALLHQYQRDILTAKRDDQSIEYIEVSLDDIALANRLAHDILGRSLDELPPQTRKLLKLIQSLVSDECSQHSLVQKDYRFSRRQVRNVVQWSDTALKVHIARLVELEYLLVHRGINGRYEYELLFDGGEDNYLMGLIDVATLQYDNNRSGQKNNQSGCGQPLVRGQSGTEKTVETLNGKGLAEIGQVMLENTAPEENNLIHRSRNGVAHALR